MMGQRKRRRSNGEGTIFWHEKRRRWIVALTLPTTDPSRPKRITRSAKTHAEALKLLRELQRLRDEGMVGTGRIPTLGQFLTQWLEGHRRSIRPLTQEKYDSIIRNRLQPELGRVRLDQLTPFELTAAYDRLLARGLSPQSVLDAHRLLHRALHDAVRWGLLPRNPCDLVTPPRVHRTPVRTLTAEQVAQLLAACAEDEAVGPLVTVAVLTGLRLGELLGLTWSDIDFARGELSVARVVHRIVGEGLVVLPPKTASSRRLIPLAPQALAALRQQRQRQLEARLRAGPAWVGGEWVFTTAIGTPYDARWVRRQFRALLARAGLPRIRFHDLRHTTASLLLAAGTHPRVVSSLLGHSTIHVTLDIYSHVTPGLVQQATTALAQLVASSTASSAADSLEQGKG